MLAAATAENTALRARQLATARVLQTIATAPAEAGRAHGMIAESACELCGAYDAVILLKRDHMLAFGAHHGPIPLDFAESPSAGRSVLEKRPVHVHDYSIAADEFPDGAEMARRLGQGSTLSAPMLSAGEAIGSITLRRFEVKPFSDDEVDLLTTFADQAAIAIGNTRLFNEVEARNREVSEALQWETATGEVLAAISRSTTELQPVLDTIISSAARICKADMAGILRREGDEFRYVSKWGIGADALEFLKGIPLVAGRGSAVGRVLLTGCIVQIEDPLTDPDYVMHEVQARIGFRSMLAVPLLRAERIIGVLVLWRRIVRAFSAREIELIETFADQAVIAIENARLFDELRESLQQQTATADVLKAISRSTFDLPVVLSTLIEAAARLCEADQGTIARERNGILLRVASHGFSPEFMLSQNVPVGAIVVGWADAGPISARQEELLKVFADQALIAIENARLFNELEAKNRELSTALEQQTATSAILRVIASSPTDLKPVLRTVAENAAQLCGADDAKIFRVQGDMLHLEASFGSIPIHFRGRCGKADSVKSRSSACRASGRAMPLAFTESAARLRALARVAIPACTGRAPEVRYCSRTRPSAENSSRKRQCRALPVDATSSLAPALAIPSPPPAMRCAVERHLPRVTDRQWEPAWLRQPASVALLAFA